MARARRGFKARRRRNRVLKLAKGFHFDRRTKFKHALITVRRALHNAYIGRRLLKRDMRRLWIVRIGAAARSLGFQYSRLIKAFADKKIMLNRKMLAELAVNDFQGFTTICNEAMKK
ncbi:MAG: 50S ribosomal protein L20 [Oligoflexia bacterium]|nr:50S ribosomal protein L20 [Oligoflexia bacterium]MBF0365939.1 50S ribosomal protein L20 [Oligoflexia bacterium]